jgi:hypothetical protein
MMTHRPYPTTRATEADLVEIDRIRATGTEGKSLLEVFQYLKTLTANPDDLADLDYHIRELEARGSMIQGEGFTSCHVS